ncbi:VWA domain-containing protein [Acidothermaceae bacterium B102]|nr:VWA domain-containing protein [Acidothermaceae bacterium B102]
MPPATVLGSVDRAAFAVALSGRLRARGVPVGLTNAEDFVRALGAAPPDTRSALYWTARVTLVRRHADLDVFDAVFAAVFDDAVLDMDPHARRTPLARTVSSDESFASLAGDARDLEAGAGLPWLTLPPSVGDADDSDSDLAVPERLPSELVGLADVAFEDLTAAEMRLLGEWLERAAPSWPTRRTRRMAEQHSGHRVAVRATIARSRRTGWEPIELVRVRAVRKPRPVVMVCDVSQSMQAQATAYFHLMRALALTADAEIFAFATTLTRLTHVLSHRSAETAIELATERVVDRFGGTRIATNLTALLSSHHGGSVRGAIVIVASDGWDSDPPEQLAAAMARLRRRAYRVIWINPRAGAPGFEPRVATMAAALPYCDRLLPADTFRSLGRVIGEVSLSSAMSPGLSSTGSRGWTAGTARR